MRFILPLAALMLGSVLPATAEETVPSVDLVAAFLIGLDDGATLGAGSSAKPATITQTGPGAFAGQPAGGAPFTFVVTEKSNCLFDIAFNNAGEAHGGVELDASKLASVAYEKLGETLPVYDYRITLSGADTTLQMLRPGGSLAKASPTTTLSTSLTIEEMQAAVGALQAACPPA